MEIAKTNHTHTQTWPQQTIQPPQGNNKQQIYTELQTHSEMLWHVRQCSEMFAKVHKLLGDVRTVAQKVRHVRECSQNVRKWLEILCTNKNQMRKHGTHQET